MRSNLETFAAKICSKNKQKSLDGANWSDSPIGATFCFWFATFCLGINQPLSQHSKILTKAGANWLLHSAVRGFEINQYINMIKKTPEYSFEIACCADLLNNDAIEPT